MGGATRGQRRAVIDIGSNSVRLVIYEGPPRTPIAVFNEKALCGLGDRVPGTGALRQDAMDEALRILRRFAAVLEDDSVEALRCFATAASREAPNGPGFLGEVRAIGFEPTLLSGEEEARLAALGILSGAPEVLAEPGGALAGDMGGGSLELSRLRRDAPEGIAERVSLPLGGLRLSTLYADDPGGARTATNEALGALGWLGAEDARPRTFFVVGGAWRAIGRLAIARDDHPISILDHFALSAGRMIELCRLIERQSPQTLAATPGVQSRRAPTLPFAAMVLRKVVQRAGVARVAISSCGVREGSLFADLTEEERRTDPLIALCGHYADRLSPGSAARRRAIYGFLAPAFAGETHQEARLRRASTKLANIAGLFHPDARANEAAVSVLNMPFISLTHEERVMLACAAYQRHTASETDFPSHLHPQLLTDEQRTWARRVGLALRFATDLDPVGTNALPRARLAVAEGALRLTLAEGDAAYLGDAPMRRFERFAGSLGLKPSVADA